MNFPCTSCGACCRHLPPHSALNTGDGVCVHLDATTQQCGVYAQRPLICRVDDLYQQHLATRLTPRVYYLVQAEGCVALDERNQQVPERVREQLAAEQGGVKPDPLTEEELHQGLQVVLLEAAPLVARM